MAFVSGGIRTVPLTRFGTGTYRYDTSDGPVSPADPNARACSWLTSEHSFTPKSTFEFDYLTAGFYGRTPNKLIVNGVTYTPTLGRDTTTSCLLYTSPSPRD